MPTDFPTERPGAAQPSGDASSTSSASEAPENSGVIDLFAAQRSWPASAETPDLDVRVGDQTPTTQAVADAQGQPHRDTSEAERAAETADERDGAPRDDAQAHTEHQTPAEPSLGRARLLVAGVGGAGCNIINYMIDSGMRGLEFLAINTDTQALSRSKSSQRLGIGENLTRGMGAGGNPAIGQQAAQENYHELVSAFTGVDMVFITAGMGGGTGTGASPIVAQAAREVGALTVAMVTTPFQFERRRRALAEQGVAALGSVVDALILVPNERLTQVVGHDTGIFEAYRIADEALRAGIQGLSDIITVPGIINLDFADVRSVMTNAGSAYLATGSAEGENRAENALHAALSNPLLDVDITGARGLLFTVTGGEDLSMREVEKIADALSAAVHPDAELIFGATYDPDAHNTLKITVVATGFEPHVASQSRPHTWTPGYVPHGPNSREGLPDVSVAGPPSLPPERAIPGRMTYDEPLPRLSPESTGRYGWNQPSQTSWPSLPPYEPPTQQRPAVNPGGGARPEAPSGSPTQRPGQPAPETPGAAGAPRSGADQLVGPSYPREEYAENTEEQEGGAHHDGEDKPGFWSRLFSSSPSSPPDGPHH